MTTYSEKLKDPRWQKKRLEILERDKWTCTYCGNKSITLHVHHSIYKDDPWDIDNDCLRTLCESCHNTEKQFRGMQEKDLLCALKEKGFLWGDIFNLTLRIKKEEIKWR